MTCNCLARHKLTILGDILDKDTRDSFCTINRDLYLVIILGNVENSVSDKYGVSKVWQHFDCLLRQQ